ncbi:hypothetical protein [Aliiroseovarius sp. S1339]|uniref:hypothetical protein n=1 Tax=Aliiroseovarius sp. S1339 TaxID=2936990 RepID=UPI0020C061C3|nr:hypothetical protein [Aliiroseovarius sp. S1339]
MATLLVCIATPLLGGEITSVDYSDLAGHLPGLVDFEDFATLPEPGQIVQGLLTFPGLTIGAQLHGQSLRAVDGFDVLDGQLSLPARASMGGKHAAIAVAYHAGFGSNAAFPLGPDGFEKRSGRGEGALALVFEGGTSAFAIKLHADYADPLGTRPAPGTVTLTFYDPTGARIAQHDLHPAHGVNEIGLLITPPAKAVTLTHHDPGGIAVDDIRYSLDSLGS